MEVVCARAVIARHAPTTQRNTLNYGAKHVEWLLVPKQHWSTL